MSFYKFRGCNDLSLSMLRHQEIYFASLDELNDPFEGQFHIAPMIGDDFQQKLDHRRVYCVAKGDRSFVENGELMWTHYADSHCGFCIEYNESLLDGFKEYVEPADIQQNVWLKANYSLSATESMIISDNGDKVLADVLRTKKRDYSYEKEVRLILHTVDPLDSIRSVNGAISAIYLGCRMDEVKMGRLKRIAEMLGVPCYKVERDKESFNLIIGKDICSKK